MMQIEVRTGKLCEVRFRPPFENDDLVQFTGTVRGIVQKAPVPIVFVTDWRAVASFSPDEVDTFVWIMRRDNPNITANGVLVDATNPTMQRQCEQIIREAANPSRRLFTSIGTLTAFLGPLLTKTESARLDEFLLESPGSPR
jgi:hypothetical protein